MKNFAFLFLIFTVLVNAQDEETQKLIDFQSLKFKYILEQAYKNSADSFNIEKISDYAFNSLLQRINKDSKYFNQEDMLRIMNRDKNVYLGTGILYTISNDSMYVIEDKNKKLNPGDRILFIDDKPVSNLKYSEINNLLKGEEGTVCKVIAKTSDGELKEIDYERKSFDDTSIKSFYSFSESDVYYINIERFSDSTGIELGNTLKKVNKIDYLIIDLRNNPGGRIEEVVSCLENFLPENLLITKLEASNPEYDKNYKTEKKGDFLDLPLAVLVDSTSKSGSELFAAAIQEYDRGIVIGSKTFGKGSVQKGFSMKDSTAFRLTVAYYYTPLGRKIEVNKNEEYKISDADRLRLNDKSVDNLQKKINKYGAGKDVKYVKTKKMRVYFQKNGIEPDYKQFADTLTLLSNVLESKGLYYGYAFDFIEKNQERLNQYNNFKQYTSNFKLKEQDIKDFIQHCISNNVWNNEMFLKDKVYILNLLKAVIAYLNWGEKAFYYQKNNIDPLIIKAIKLRGESIELLN